MFHFSVTAPYEHQTADMMSLHDRCIGSTGWRVECWAAILSENSDFPSWALIFATVRPCPDGRPAPNDPIGHQRMVSKQHWSGPSQALCRSALPQKAALAASSRTTSTRRSPFPRRHSLFSSAYSLTLNCRGSPRCLTSK